MGHSIALTLQNQKCPKDRTVHTYITAQSAPDASREHSCLIHFQKLPSIDMPSRQLAKSRLGQTSVLHPAGQGRSSGGATGQKR